jgi:putative heme-binding domain-containing protein
MWHELNLTGAQRRLLELLSDPDPAVRIIALRWIGEERLTRLRPELPRVFTAGSMTQNVFACYLAAVEKLDSPPRRDADEWASDDYLARMLAASDADPTLIAMALRAIEPHHPVLTAERCEHWLASDHSAIKREAVRTLRETQSLERQLLLSRLVRDEQLPEDLRAEAAVGLTAESSADTQKLLALAGEVPDSVAAEVLRGLVGTPLNEQHQQPLAALAKRSPALAELAQRLLAGTTASPMPDVNDLDAWVEIAKQPSDAAVGGRIFYQKKLAMCGKCHQMQGRGGRIGPDLTMAASQLELRRLIESIIHPSREIAPHFVTWGVRTTDGRQLVGQLLDELPDGTQSFANAQGEMFALKPSEIGERQALATSIMPEGLAANLTRQEFADLIAFLRQSHRP